MFLNICHGLGRLRLPVIAAVLRLILHMLLAPFTAEERYANPSRVGYRGWVEVPRLGVLAFRRMDGKLQYKW